MVDGGSISKRSIGAMEFLATGGFAFYFAWMFISFYWLSSELLLDHSLVERDGIQLFVFAGLVVGYYALHFLGKRESYDNDAPAVFVVETAFLLLFPFIALLLAMGIDVPVPMLCAVDFCTGLGGAAAAVAWLDACGRIRIFNYQRFTGLSLLGGGAMFAVVAFVPLAMQPVLCIVFVAMSGILLLFVRSRSGGAEDDLDGDIQDAKNVWTFAREIEPSLVAFGIVFGLTFACLFNDGSNHVLAGLASTMVGSAAVAFAAMDGKNIGITLMQRVLCSVIVLACLLRLLSSDVVLVVFACLVLAAWAAFTAVNYALVVKKSYRFSTTGNFRQIPSHLALSAVGFFLGWGIAAVATFKFEPGSMAFQAIYLIMAFAVVAVIMLFFPVGQHHDEQETGDATASAPVPPVVKVLSGKELFERRCAAVAELYQLSPRETEILGYLAKGRNAAYIQNKLTISPHTVKSHIYNIYRKLDIHSQQKLMDFIEVYPIDVSDLESQSES